MVLTMKDYPLISIVTATYKKFDNISDTIGSVLMQNYPNIEYIITDDGSDNFPEKEIRDFLEANHKGNITRYDIIHHEKNIGTVKNLNNAFRKAKGKYIMPLSAEDMFTDNTVVSRIVERFALTDADLIVTSRLLTDEEDNAIELLPHYVEREVIEKYNTGLKQYYAHIVNLSYDMASGSAMYYSKRILEELDYFDEAYYLWEDGPFLLKYTWTHRIEFCYDIISIYYKVGGISSADTKQTSSRGLLLKDADVYFKNDMYEHYDELPYTARRYLNYSSKVRNNPDRFSKIKYYIAYPDVCLRNELYRRKRNKNALKDIKILKEMHLIDQGQERTLR